MSMASLLIIIRQSKEYCKSEDLQLRALSAQMHLPGLNLNAQEQDRPAKIRNLVCRFTIAFLKLNKLST